MKNAGPDVPSLETTKPAGPLNTVPVGVDVSVLPEGGGMVTIKGIGAIVERSNSRAVVRHPERRCRAEGDAPGIHQVGIGNSRQTCNVGNEVDLFVPARSVVLLSDRHD